MIIFSLHGKNIGKPYQKERKGENVDIENRGPEFGGQRKL
jgi:hypothetical protein